MRSARAINVLRAALVSAAILLPIEAFAAPTVTKLCSGIQAGTGTSVTCTTTADSPAGNTIVVVFFSSASVPLGTVIAPSWDGINIYAIGSSFNNGARFRMFWSQLTQHDPVGTPFAVIYPSVANDKAITVYSVSGAIAFDQEGVSGSATSSSPSFTGNSIDIAGGTQQAVAFGAVAVTSSAAATVTEASGWTTLDDLSSSAKFHTAYKVVSTPTPVTYNPTYSGTAHGWIDNIDVFKVPPSCAAGTRDCGQSFLLFGGGQ